MLTWVLGVFLLVFEAAWFYVFWHMLRAYPSVMWVILLLVLIFCIWVTYNLLKLAWRVENWTPGR